MSGVRPSPWQAAARRANRAAPTNKCGMRNSECGMAVGSRAATRDPPWDSAFRIPHSAFASFIPNSAFRILSLAQREEIREEAIGPRDPRRQLPEEAQPGVHVRALAHRGHEQSALERWLARIVYLDQ